MHSSFPVLCSFCPLHRSCAFACVCVYVCVCVCVCVCVYVCLSKSFAAVTRVQFTYFYLKVLLLLFLTGFFLFCCCYGEVTESYIGYTIYRMCLCVHVWMRGVCACVCRSVSVCASLCFFSNTTWGSLKLMGPPVASLLIFLHPSPLGRVLATRP